MKHHIRCSSVCDEKRWVRHSSAVGKLAFRRDVMSKHELLQQIAELIDLQENAIQQHPAEIASVYIKGRDAFIEGQRTAKETEWARTLSLTLGELSLMHRYMLSSSFISAWYHLAGDEANRDKAAHSCSILVASLGPASDEVMRKYIEYEQLWRRTMEHEGVTPRRLSFIGPIILLAIIGIILIVIFSR